MLETAREGIYGGKLGKKSGKSGIIPAWRMHCCGAFPNGKYDNQKTNFYNFSGEENVIMNKETKENIKMQVYSKADLLEIFPFGRTKLQQLLTAGVLPVVKVCKAYLTSDAQIQRWLLENTGKEIFY